MPKIQKTYQIMLGTFIKDKFVWHEIEGYDDMEPAYKAFKAYVNTQLKYTDEELKKVWQTGRLDIELRQGTKLLNWVGVYARAALKDTDDEKEAKKDKPSEPEKTPTKHDSLDDWEEVKRGKTKVKDFDETWSQRDKEESAFEQGAEDAVKTLTSATDYVIHGRYDDTNLDDCYGKGLDSVVLCLDCYNKGIKACNDYWKSRGIEDMEEPVDKDFAEYCFDGQCDCCSKKTKVAHWFDLDFDL